MTQNQIFSGVVSAIRAASKGSLPEEIHADHSCILDLGLDSLSIAVLSLALEDTFSRPVLLDGWLGQHADPAALTVGSLCDYIQVALKAA